MGTTLGAAVGGGVGEGVGLAVGAVVGVVLGLAVAVLHTNFEVVPAPPELCSLNHSVLCVRTVVPVCT